MRTMLPSGPVTDSDWSPKRVLVVDANPDRLRLIGLRLRAEGYRVLGAMDGIMATHVATTERPDVIVLDSSMADARGQSLARRWRSHIGTMAIPIVPLLSLGETEGPSDLLTLVEQASSRRPAR